MAKDKSIIELKKDLIIAGKSSVKELIKVAKEKIVQPKYDSEDPDKVQLAADKLKNAAAAKRLAIFDGFDILEKIEAEEANIESIEKGSNPLNSSKGFAESHAK